jgi:hypothetical protein
MIMVTLMIYSHAAVMVAVISMALVVCDITHYIVIIPNIVCI